MKKKCIAIMIVLCCFGVYTNAQEVDDAGLIDSIKTEITKIFIKENLLDENKARGNVNYVFATELKQKRSIGYDTSGIYRVGVYQSHSPEYILIKQRKEFWLFNLEEIGTVLKEVINYSEKNNIDIEMMLVYIKEVIDIYQGNHHIGNIKVKKK